MTEPKLITTPLHPVAVWKLYAQYLCRDKKHFVNTFIRAMENENIRGKLSGDEIRERCYATDDCLKSKAEIDYVFTQKHIKEQINEYTNNQICKLNKIWAQVNNEEHHIQTQIYINRWIGRRNMVNKDEVFYNSLEEFVHYIGGKFDWYYPSYQIYKEHNDIIT